MMINRFVFSQKKQVLLTNGKKGITLELFFNAKNQYEKGHVFLKKMLAFQKLL